MQVRLIVDRVNAISFDPRCGPSDEICAACVGKDKLRAAAHEGAVGGIIAQPQYEDVDGGPFCRPQIDKSCRDLAPTKPWCQLPQQGVRYAGDLAEPQILNDRIRVGVERREKGKAGALAAIADPIRLFGQHLRSPLPEGRQMQHREAANCGTLTMCRAQRLRLHVQGQRVSSNR